jgi:hypothetical protein
MVDNMHDLMKSWGLGDSGDTPIYAEVGLKMTKNDGNHCPRATTCRAYEERT